MVYCVLFCLLITGWAFVFSKCFNTGLSLGYFNAIPLAGLVSFLGFLAAIPTFTAWSLVALGIAGFLWLGVSLVRNSTLKDKVMPVILIFLVLSLLCFLFVWGLKFRSIDDYSFWGVISKYLFTFNALPDNGDFINPRYLSYIPALASIHYLLYSLAHHYSSFLGYFAQGMILIAAWMVVVDEKNVLRSVIYLCLWYLGFALAYGAVFGRMEVDAYVAAYFFAISWVIYKKEANTLLLIAMPIVFMSTIKEIGLLFAFSALMMYACIHKPKGKRLLYLVLLAVVLIALKSLWKYHVVSLGFQSFAKAISVPSAISSLNPLNPWYHTVQFLFLKELFLSKFDHLIHIPYVFFYALIINLYFYLVNTVPEKKSQIKTLFMIFALTALIYLLMLYWLQAIVFNVGNGTDHILDFQRYYNMLFLPWMLLFVCIYLDVTKPIAFTMLKNPLTIGILLTAGLMLFGGKIERMHKYYNPNNILHTYQLVAQRTQNLPDAHWSLCLINIPDPDYDTVMPLTYFLMPHRVITATNTQNKDWCNLTLSLDNMSFQPPLA